MNDEKIIELFWVRSEMAITETAVKYQKYCMSIAYNILRDLQDADECVNDTYLKTWNTIPNARPNRLSTFIGTITRNLSFDRYKKKNADKRGGGIVDVALSELEECIPSNSGVEQEFEEAMLVEAINNFLKGLPKQQRMVFVCRYWYMNKIDEISGNFGMSESNVKTTLFRLRNKLKLYLQKAGVIV